MTTAQKIATSFLLSVLIFAAFTVVAFSGLFSVFETKFYQPTKTESIQKDLSIISNSLDEYNSIYLERFSAFSSIHSLSTVMEPIQTDEDIKSRADLYGQLVTSGTKGLSGIRVVGSNGKYLHYSTYASDMLKQQATKIAYQNYTELTINGISELTYQDIQCTQDKTSRIIYDPANNRIIYAYPFFDQNQLYRGTVLFYVKGSDFSRYLREKNNIGLTEEFVLGGSIEKPAFIEGFEVSLQESMNEFLIKNWTEGNLNNVKFNQTDADNSSSWILFTNSDSTAYIAALYPEDIFIFPIVVKIVLLLCVFITGFLGIFLIFNLKQDDMTIVRNRVKRFQFALLSEYVNKNTDDWSKIKREIESQKEDVNKNVRRSLGHRAKKYSKELDELLNQSWYELLSAVSSRNGLSSSNINPALSNQNVSSLDMDEIRNLLEQIISSGHINSASSSKQEVSIDSNKAVFAPKTAELQDADELVEEADEVAELADAVVEEADEVAELADADELVEEADEVAELADADEVVEEADEVAELADAVVEEADEVAELADADEVVEEADEVAELADADELVEEADEVAELADADEVVEEADEVAELEDVGELVEEADEVAELADADEVVEEADEVAELADADEVVEEADEVAELADADELVEEADEVAELADADEVVEEVAELEEADALVEEADEVAELADADEVVEEVDEVAELEEADELVEEADEVAELEEADELVEEADEVAELADADEVVEEADEVAELADADELVALDQLDPDFEGLEDLEKLDEITESEKQILEYEIIQSNKIIKPTKDEIENVFAEEICLGEKKLKPKGNASKEIFTDFGFFRPDFSSLDEMKKERGDKESAIKEQSIEEPDDVIIFDEVPFSFTIDFSNIDPIQKMKEFGFDMDFQDEDDEMSNTIESINSIQKKDDVYSIKKDISLQNDNMNVEFKELVDTVLKRED